MSKEKAPSASVVARANEIEAHQRELYGTLPDEFGPTIGNYHRRIAEEHVRHQQVLAPLELELAAWELLAERAGKS